MGLRALRSVLQALPLKFRASQRNSSPRRPSAPRMRSSNRSIKALACNLALAVAGCSTTSAQEVTERPAGARRFQGADSVTHVSYVSKIAPKTPQAGEPLTLEMALQVAAVRNPRLVADAKAHYGTACTVCGFDFERVYGELGAVRPRIVA